MDKYICGFNLMLGDCLERMKEIEDKSIDMILCDLPYGTTQCKWDNVIPFEPLWEQYKRIIKDNGAVVLFGSEPFSSKLRLSNLKWYKYDWIWNKKRGSGFLNAKRQPLRNHEIISVFYKKQCTYNPQFTKRVHERDFRNTVIKPESDIYGKINSYKSTITKDSPAYPKSIIEIRCLINNEKEKVAHPTQKPVALLEYLIKTYTNEGETVLDNTMGSGSTGVACVNTNRKFIGIEMDENYFNIACDRIDGAIREKEQNLFKDNY